MNCKMVITICHSSAKIGPEMLNRLSINYNDFKISQKPSSSTIPKCTDQLNMYKISTNPARNPKMKITDAASSIWDSINL